MTRGLKYPDYTVFCVDEIGTCVVRWRNPARNRRFHIWIDSDGTLQNTIHSNVIKLPDGKSDGQMYRMLRPSKSRSGRKPKWAKIIEFLQKSIDENCEITKAKINYEKAIERKKRKDEEDSIQNLRNEIAKSANLNLARILSSIDGLDDRSLLDLIHLFKTI